MYNLDMLDAADCLGGVWPAIKPCHKVPERLTTYYAKTAKDNADAFCHFFIDDYRFERVWNDPARYVPVIKNYAGALMTDFSTYHIMPLPMQYWNMYRNRALAYYWQQNGIEVIPTLQCGDPRTYDYAFEGLPIGGTYAVSNNGLMKDAYNRRFFYESLLIGVQAVHPDVLVCYGNEVDLSALPCEVIWYKNDNTARVRKNVPYLPVTNKRELASAPDDAIVDLDEVYDNEIAAKTSDRYERAVSTTRERKPLMYNNELDGFEPFYVTELGIVPPMTNPPKHQAIKPINGEYKLNDGSIQTSIELLSEE